MKAVIFDLDGTLLDRESSLVKFIGDQYDRLRDLLGHVPREIYCQRFIALDDNGYVWKDKVYTDLVAELNITGISAADLLADYTAEFKHACIAFPNLHDMLSSLKAKGVKLGMITNGLGQFQMDNIESLGIKDYFETILISEWEGMKKPVPEIFIKALDRLGVAPEEALYVGDHGVNDILGAKNVGMKAAWKKHSHGRDLGADFVIDDLMELLDIVKI